MGLAPSVVRPPGAAVVMTPYSEAPAALTVCRAGANTKTPRPKVRGPARGWRSDLFPGGTTERRAVSRRRPGRGIQAIGPVLAKLGS